jgi:pantetheine-phosphate adenylyltransferase
MTKRLYGLYPGSFDPVTNGHLDIIRRALKVCGRLNVAVVTNPAKKPLFTPAERVHLLRKTTEGMKGVHVTSFDGLLVDYARDIGANIVFRGLRAVSDFEHEFQMALMNRTLQPGIEVIFLVPNEKFIFLSSNAIKEIARLGGDVSEFVPAVVGKALASRFAIEKNG